MACLNQIVSAVKVKVDEFTFGIISGSLTFKEGLPERTAKGLDNGDVSISDDLETAIGMIKFDVPTTGDNMNNAKTIGTRSEVTVKFYNENGIERVMKCGVLKNDQEWTVSTDGKATLTFDGTPLS